MTRTPVIVDTAALAELLGRDPAYVRLLVHRGVITPCGRQARRAGSGGRPRLLFDLREVRDTLRGTRHWPEDVTARN